ncbi:MAG: CDP-alcohol phosphatidyltransferase family protein [Elusimicrobiales bacterium]|nr:CDP-alcohol phosphatidyltransferase family protein [Elusimicrobiales bacterium]
MEPKPLYKAVEMEEWLDLRFFHPLGCRLALAARALGLVPDQVTYISMVFGVAGGFMLASWKTAAAGWALMVFSSVLDSADGQLARMTGGGTLQGRILDGLIGYFTFTAAYIGLLLLNTGSSRSLGVFAMASLIVAGGVFTAFESSLYDFYRTTFAAIVSKGTLPGGDKTEELGWFLKFSYSSYGAYQRFFAASHLRLLAALRAKYPQGAGEGLRAGYLRANRANVHVWNLLGDNTRFLLIGLCLVLRRPEWYFYIVIGPLSVLMLAMTLVQRRADRELASEFLES